MTTLISAVSRLASVSKTSSETPHRSLSSEQRRHGHCAHSEGDFQKKACVLSLSQEVRKAQTQSGQTKRTGQKMEERQSKQESQKSQSVVDLVEN